MGRHSYFYYQINKSRGDVCDRDRSRCFQTSLTWLDTPPTMPILYDRVSRKIPGDLEHCGHFELWIPWCSVPVSPDSGQVRGPVIERHSWAGISVSLTQSTTIWTFSQMLQTRSPTLPRLTLSTPSHKQSQLATALLPSSLPAYCPKNPLLAIPVAYHQSPASSLCHLRQWQR